MDKVPTFMNGPYRYQSNKALMTVIHDLEAHRGKYNNAEQAIAKAWQILAEREMPGVSKIWEEDEIVL